ncbi:MAG: glycosyltransferase 87 family protein, partial [Acidobacteriaceae bacterium]
MKTVEANKRPTERSLNKNSTLSKTLRASFAIAIALAGIFVFTRVLHPAAMDLIEYWSSAKLLLHHINPYSPSGVFALEKAEGFLPSSPLVMLNPPWALFLILPLGFGGAHTALFLWTIAAFGCVLAFIRLLEVPEKNAPLALFFAPVLASICSGQSSPFLLLGFALFLRFHRSRPFWAGASLLLMAIKPHLFLVFWAVLLAESIYRRRFRIIAGAAAALAVTSAFATALDPHVWTHYIFMMRASA